MTSSTRTTETEVLRQLYDAINSNVIEAVLRCLDADIERIEPEGFPTSGSYRGYNAMKARFLEGRQNWAEGSCEPEDFVFAGEFVIALVHVRVRLKEHTEWIDARTADVFTFRNGKVLQMRTFADRDKAFKWAAP